MNLITMNTPICTFAVNMMSQDPMQRKLLEVSYEGFENGKRRPTR